MKKMYRIINFPHYITIFTSTKAKIDLFSFYKLNTDTELDETVKDYQTSNQQGDLIA